MKAITKRVLPLITACAGLVIFSAPGCGGGMIDGPTTRQEQSAAQPGDQPEEPKPTAGTGIDPTSGMPDDTWHTGVNTGPPTEVGLLPPADPLVRPRRRMDVDQLKHSFYRVTEGVGWTRVSGNNVIDKFDDFAATLGKPDYVQSTLEDLAPGALFQKFLGDAAREVCASLLQRELSTDVADRVFWTEVSPTATPADDHDGIVDNLVALKLRFHGQTIGPDDPALAQALWLFESSYHIAKDPKVAWNTVCVGLFTHPDFYTF